MPSALTTAESIDLAITGATLLLALGTFWMVWGMRSSALPARAERRAHSRDQLILLAHSGRDRRRGEPRDLNQVILAWGHFTDDLRAGAGSLEGPERSLDLDSMTAPAE
jgi:Mlc titration factor MtfA (ptsG expression regulator)